MAKGREQTILPDQSQDRYNLIPAIVGQVEVHITVVQRCEMNCDNRGYNSWRTALC